MRSLDLAGARHIIGVAAPARASPLRPMVSRRTPIKVISRRAGLVLAALSLMAVLSALGQGVTGENPSGAQAGVNRSRWTMHLGARYRF